MGFEQGTFFLHSSSRRIAGPSHATMRYMHLLWLAPLLAGYWLYRTFFVAYPKYYVDESLDLTNPDSTRIIACLSDALYSEGNRAEILNNGDRFYPAELEAIRNAKHSVNIEIYTFLPGDVGAEFVKTLIERARNGVKVRFLIDAFGGGRLSLHRETLRSLEEAGVAVCFHEPLSLRRLEKYSTRTHREIFVMDGRIAFVGGAGIADQWLKESRGMKQWRDCMVRIEGPAVASIQSVFLENWTNGYHEIVTSAELFPKLEPAGDLPCLVINSSAHGDSSPARVLHHVLIASARETVKIGSPYFIPDSAALRELVKAADRGVKVTVLTTGKNTDHATTRVGSRRLYGRLLKAGVTVYEYQGAMYHTKVLLVDDRWGVVGTSNFDNRSLSINDEICVAFPGGSTVQTLADDFARDLQQSEQITMHEWNRRSILERMHAQLSRLIERQQ